jgi:hypothetical protein
MTFYELDMLHQVGLGAATFEAVGEVERAEPPHCEVCGWRLGLLRRLPPYDYKMTSKHVADLVTDGGVFAVSPQFEEQFVSAGLKGLEFSQSPVHLTNSSAVIYIAQPAYTYTLIDTEASGAVVREFVGCKACGSAAYNKIDRIVIREDTWTGEDVFTLSSLKGVVLVTQRFVDFVNANQFSGFSFKHQDDFHFDYTSVFER